MKNYELIEHTADLAVRVRGKDLNELFKNTALAIFEISSEKLRNKDIKHKKIIIKQKADNLPELFVNWLNEVISLSAAKGLIFDGFQISKLTENNLEAVASCSDIKNYKINSEIKAATYHELHIEKNESGWQAEVIFDV
ncbi:MAG: archease [Candidatus Omnitrophica bacterium]|nr:archease [Candidatus Omnitrophota bacterium]MDD5237786.1 archease [Candidatus Omnitrophota bacterium]